MKIFICARFVQQFTIWKPFSFIPLQGDIPVNSPDSVLLGCMIRMNFRKMFPGGGYTVVLHPCRFRMFMIAHYNVWRN